MQADDPPYLLVGTAVSAKYKGAFCEAKVSRVVRMVKCKVVYKMGLGNATVTDHEVKGPLRVGQVVQAKHSDKKELVEATITKIQDCSQYTVVFDDGDITTLRRTALCLKSGRHFNESETLDQLPLTHPEHFSNPVVGGRRGRRNRHLKDDSSDEDIEEENNPDLEGYTQDIGRVVSVESTEKKRGKDSWFPGLVVIPSPQPTVRVNVKDEYLIRSFKDGRYYTVPKKEVSEFNRELALKIESAGLVEAVQKAIKFLDDNELPLHWDKSSLFNTATDSYNEDVTDTSDDEPSEEKDRFVAQLYKFMDDSGTPLNKTPSVSNKDIDLHRLFRVVQKMGGYNRVTNHSKWRSVTGKLKLPSNQNISSQVKLLYRKCLLSYESFHRTLGVTMLNPIRSSKKNVNRGRSLIRDKDKSTPANSPKPEKDDEYVDKLEEKKDIVIEKIDPKAKKKLEVKDTKKIKAEEVSDTNDTDTSEPVASTSTMRAKKKDKKISKPSEKKVRSVGETLKPSSEEQDKKEEKGQLTRSKSQILPKVKEVFGPVKQAKETPPRIVSKLSKKVISKEDDKKQKGKKKMSLDSSSDSGSTTDSSVSNVNIGDKLIVYYGPTNESKVTYEAKVVDVDRDQTGPIYLVHYTGWNTRYDEWIPAARIAENISTSTKARKFKLTTVNSRAPSTSSTSIIKQAAVKKGRATSVSSRATTSDQTPRSTTPSSVTSSGSRTKSPATPATRSIRLAARQNFAKKRRISAQTDISVQSESESDISESENELSRTRSGSIKVEDDGKSSKVKAKASLMTKSEKRKEHSKETDNETEEEGEKVVKKLKKIKKTSEKSAEESDDDSISHPKGRDFDLNQIRSELKGFNKALKIPNPDNLERESISSSDESTTLPPLEKQEEKPEDSIDIKVDILDKSLSSDDIYEFKEPEPFEFEARSKLVDDKIIKKRLPRILEDLEKSPKHKISKLPSTSIEKSESMKIFDRISTRSIDDSDNEDDDKIIVVDEEKDIDPFDKLVESPSFNFIKCSPEKAAENKSPVQQNLLEEPLSLFRELPETADEYSRDMELSDCESQTQIFTRSDDLFASSFSKPSPDRNTLDMEFSSGKTDEGKTTNSDEDDMIQAQIQRVIAQSSTDDDSNDTLIAPPVTYSGKIEEPKPLSILGVSVSTTEPLKTSIFSKSCDLLQQKETNIVEEKEPLKQISPALQETDSTLLESIVSKPPMLLNPKVDDTGKELTVKTGTKIADSILQKFNFIKNNIELKAVKSEQEISSSATSKAESKSEVKPEYSGGESASDKLEDKMEIESEVSKKEEEEEEEGEEEEEEEEEDEEIKTKPESSEIPVRSPNSEPTEPKRLKRGVSKSYVDDLNSDSSDSEQLVIVRSDDDSHTDFSFKPLLDCKKQESKVEIEKIESEDAKSEPEERNFKFDEVEKSETEEVEIAKELQLEVEEVEVESESSDKQKDNKEEQQEPNLHSLLFCEEEIPRSPAPVTESSSNIDTPLNTSVHEIPFASAPGTSNSKMLLEQKRAQPTPLIIPIEKERSSNAQVVIDNTPPTTPETTVSNLSPREENDDISPNTNDSGKSNDGDCDYTSHRRSSLIKVSPYSEEDTQMTSDINSTKKALDSCAPPASCRKRRRSLRTSEDAPLMPVLSAKRGRKPLCRQRRDSDSDDTSEYSNAGSGGGGTTPGSTTSLYDRSSRSPRPSKYNFYVEFDPSLDSGQRIAVLQQKLSELRKTYADVKAELATVERRRKKIRRREREALKVAKQEMACA